LYNLRNNLGRAAFQQQCGSLSLPYYLLLPRNVLRIFVTRRAEGIGMLHFNGGARSNENAFETNSVLKRTPNNTWKLVDYYTRLDWAWAKYMVESHVPGGNVEANGYQLVVRY
jgi:hypothetical protein